MESKLGKLIDILIELGLFSPEFKTHDVHYLVGHLVVRFEPETKRITVNHLRYDGLGEVELPIVYEYILDGAHAFYGDMVTEDIIVQALERFLEHIQSVFALPYRERSKSADEVLREASDSFVDKLGFAGALDLPKEENTVDRYFADQMKDGYYIPEEDEPSPFGDGDEWIYWKHRRTPKPMMATVHSLRNQLVQMLEKEQPRTQFHLEEYVPRKRIRGRNCLLLGYVVHVRWRGHVTTYQEAHNVGLSISD